MSLLLFYRSLTYSSFSHRCTLYTLSLSLSLSLLFWVVTALACVDTQLLYTSHYPSSMYFSSPSFPATLLSSGHHTRPLWRRFPSTYTPNPHPFSPNPYP